MNPANTNDTRESLVNDRQVGPASHIQLPREAVTRVFGLVIDLDADKLKPNPWFPPAADAESFYHGIVSVLERHPVLSHAEIRDSGRWLHAITWFEQPAELRSPDDQMHWTAMHKLLMASIPCDSSAPPLIGLTRPVNATNSKTGHSVQILKAGVAVSIDALYTFVEEVQRNTFRTLASILYGNKRIAPCPFCEMEGSHFEIGDRVGHCYGNCKHVQKHQIFDPIFKPSGSVPKPSTPKPKKGGTTGELPVFKIDTDMILEVDTSRVHDLIIRFGKK